MNGRIASKVVAFGLLAAALLALAEPAAAQAFGPVAAPVDGTIPSLNPANGMLPNPGALFGSLASQAMTIRNTISNYATMLFAALVVLDIAWTVIQAMLGGRSDLAELFVQLTQKAIVFSLVYWVFVVNGFGIATTIIASFVQLGMTTGSAISSGPTDPIGILLEGFQNAAPSITEAAVLGAVPDEFFATGFSNLLTGLIDLTAMTAVITVGAYAFLAGTLALAIVEAYVVTAAGVIMTGFLGSRWTAGIGEKYYSYAVSVGVKLLMVYICIGLIHPLDTMVQEYNAVPLLGGFVALVAAVIAYSAPQFAASLISGSSNSSFGQFAGQFAGLASAGFKAAGGAVSGAGSAALTARNSITSGNPALGSAGKGGSDESSQPPPPGDAVSAPTDTPLSNESLDGKGADTPQTTSYLALGSNPQSKPLAGLNKKQKQAAEFAKMDAAALKANVTPEAIRELDRASLDNIVHNENFAQLPLARRMQSIAALTNKQQTSPLGKAVEKAARSPFDAGASLMTDIGKSIHTEDHGSTGAVSIRVNV